MPLSPRLLRPRAAASTAFDPRSIAGLALWLDAGDSSSVTLNSGNVSEWRDKSGNGKHYAQSTAASQPAYVASGQNARSVIRTDGTKHLRRESGGSPLVESLNYFGETTQSVFIAWKATSRSFANYLFWANNNNGTVRLQITGPASGSGSLAQYFIDSGNSTAGRLSTTTSALTFTNSHLIAFRRDGSSYAAWANGTSVGTATNASAPAFSTSGTASIFTALNNAGGLLDGAGAITPGGDLYEIACYSRSLTDSERQAIERYIGAKWGITVA